MASLIQELVANSLIDEFEERFRPEVLDLAFHASLPVALTPELLHFIRINFLFEEASQIGTLAEADLLLSPICEEVGDALFQIIPAVRDRLLEGLVRKFGEERLHNVANLLWQYNERFSPWKDNTNLERAQQLTALNFLDPSRAQEWLIAAEKQDGPDQALDKRWFVAMRNETSSKRDLIERVSANNKPYLARESRARLRQALLQVLPEQIDQELLLNMGLGESFHALRLAPDDPITRVTMLIDWADRHVKIEDLIQGALRYEPGNLALMRQAVAFGISSAEDLARIVRERATKEIDARQLDEARRLLEQALALLDSSPDSSPLESAVCLRELAHVLDLLGKVPEARIQLERAVALLSAELGSQDERTHEYEALLAQLQAKAPSDRFDKFTERARRVLQLAQEEAQRFNHNYIGTEHILLGLVREGDGIAARVLNNLGIELHKVRSAVEFIIGRGDRQVLGEIGLTPRAKRVIELAVDEARRLNHHYIGTEHLLLGLVRDEEGIAAGVLESVGVSLEKVRRQVIEVLKSSSYSPPGDKPFSKSPYVEALGTDLTALVAAGKLGHLVGRQKEIERVIQILSHRTKNNPALIGEPGVGRTTIVEGLAQRIINNEVPETLRGKQVLALDMGALVAGTKYPGEFEERLKKVVAEIKDSGAILFIDELYALVGAGAAEGAADAAYILKPAVSHGELQVICATTIDEYRKHIEPDPAVERVFQRVQVDEPSPEETLEILREVVGLYEEYHNLKITDEALKAAVSLAARYITDRFLPDKAIDLVDEAASRVRLYRAAEPAELTNVRQELEATIEEKESLVASEDYERAADAREREQDLRKRILRMEEGFQAERSGYFRYITEEDIAQVVSIWTGLPVKDIVPDESDRPVEGIDLSEVSPGTSSPIEATDGSAEGQRPSADVSKLNVPAGDAAPGTATEQMAASTTIGEPADVSLAQVEVEDDEPLTRRTHLDDVQPNASMEDLLKASEQQYRTLKYGDVIEGSIVKVDRDEIMVDIGDKTEGIIPSREAQSLSDTEREALQIGDEVLVSVVQPASSDGNAILSLDRPRQERAWRDLHKRFEAGEIIQAQVVGHNKGGLLVNLEGIRGFVPSSQISSMPPGEANKQAELARLHNQTLPLKIIEINRNRNRLILSERQAMQEQREGMRARLMRELEPGQVRPGTVTSIADFGAFVDIGGADGLIHLSELSWKRVSNPREVLKEGDRINVYVLSVDPNERKIALSLKRTQPEPWETITDTYQLGQVVRGTITQITTFGAFARLDDGIEGLIHVSELAEGRVAHPKNVVKEGDALDLKVIRIDPARKRIGLSLKRMNEGTQAQEGADEGPANRLMRDLVTPAAVEEAATMDPVLSAESPAGPTPQGYAAAAARPQERREQPAPQRPSQGQAGGGRRNIPAADEEPMGALAAALAAHTMRQADDEDDEAEAASDYAADTSQSDEEASPDRSRPHTRENE